MKTLQITILVLLVITFIAFTPTSQAQIPCPGQCAITVPDSCSGCHLALPCGPDWDYCNNAKWNRHIEEKRTEKRKAERTKEVSHK